MKSKQLPLSWIFLLAPIGFIITLLFYKLLGESSFELQKYLGINQPRMFSLLIYTLSTGIGVLIYFFLLKSKGFSMKKAGYRNKLTLKGVFGAIIAFLIISFVFYPVISSTLAYFDIPMFWKSIGQTAVKQNGNQDIFLGILTAVILAPLTEDTIFRGYIYQMLSEKINYRLAILISSLLFAVIHINFFGPGLTIWVFFFGIASAYLYKKFNSIYPSLLFHALNNFWAYIIVPMIF